MLAYRNWRDEPRAWAQELGVSDEAIDVYLRSDVIDLHIDSFIWTRIWGYDLGARHDHGLLGARYYSQVDFPRIREAQVGGAIWVITTNPATRRSQRGATFLRNLARLRAIIDAHSDDIAFVRTVGEYRAARAAGKHAAWIGVQGGNAFDGDPDLLERIPEQAIIRCTLVHLSSSSLGRTSAPLGGMNGISASGRAMVERMNAAKIFVDLAHINRRGFYDALDAHSHDVPPIVTHTGISGAYKHWRNLDDAQVRAIADRGGTIGLMYASIFLGSPYWGGAAERIVDHLAHLITVGGEDCASLGSDWDGAIVTPRDMPTCLELPRLVQLMLNRKWSHERIAKILGGNWLRVLGQLRG